MKIKKYKNDLMYPLGSTFIQDIFKRAISRFNGSKEASIFLRIPYSSLRGYKNGYFDSLPKSLLNTLIKLGAVSKKEIEAKKITASFREELNGKILEQGRIKRKEQLSNWKKEIPSFKEVHCRNYLNFEKWLSSYQKLINFGARKFNYIRAKGNYLEVSYHTHSGKSKKEFILKYPRRILIDREFIYFFGLWVGDKAGGGRFGIMNKQPTIVSFTKEYLRKLYQNSEVVLYIANNQELPNNQKFDKIVRINQKKNGYAFSTHAINGIMVSFFDYLKSNLNEFLSSIREPNIFFAGLFDAEGNIFLEDSCFRWSCMNPELIKIFRLHLSKLDLFDRFDGINLITYNKSCFSDRILPYLIHPNKINNSNLVCFGKGELDRRFLDILEVIEQTPGINNNELAKLLKRKKIYAQVRVLENLGYIYSKGYPKQFFVNNKQNIVNNQ